MTLPSTDEIRTQVQRALQEDIRSGDVSAELIPEDIKSTAQLICREDAILCGCDWFENAFYILNPDIEIKWFFNDADSIKTNAVICTISGAARDILTAERTALNFLQTLSATATLTSRYAQAIKNTSCKILDTRKTIPGLRLAQKYAVTCGGGHNHRVGLYDMILIKENHIYAAGSITRAVNAARQIHPDLKIEVEAENIEELQESIDNQVDRVLLDNMDIKMLEDAVKLADNRIALEASGNITLENILSIAQTGVDYISTGAITKNITAIDFSLRFIEN